MPQVNFTQGIMKYNDIKPIFAGMSQCKSLHSYGPAVRHHCIIHFCSRGKGVFRNDAGTYEISAGQAFIINPDEITFYQADENDPWFYTWIAFSGSVCDKIKELPSVISINNGKIFSTISTLVAEGVSVPEDYLVCLIKLLKELVPVSDESLPSLAARVKDYIKLHYMEDISVEQLASVFNVDRRYLLRLFKREFGFTMVNYLIRTRFEAACEFLRAGFAVNKTAVMCGYSDAYNFSKMFKKYYGVSPSELRSKDISVRQAVQSEDNDYIYCN